MEDFKNKNIPGIIEGAGIGGKGGGTPDQDRISGTSTAYVYALFGIGEGTIEGLKAGAKSIQLDGTPIENADGTKNFSDFKFIFTPGLQSQANIPSEANEVSSESAVGVEVLKLFPVTRQITNPDINGIRIRLGFQLQEQEKESGDINSLACNFAIYIKEGNGAFVERLAYRNNEFKYRFTSLTEFTYFFPVNSQITDTFQIKVEKISEDAVDNEDVVQQRTVRWQAYAEVIQDTLEYPWTALCYMQFPGNAFKSVPTRKYLVGGIKWLIPTVFTVGADRGLDYNGQAWGGGFYEPDKAPADAAWVVWGLLTNNRYGLGRKIAGRLGLGRGLQESDIDKFALYQCSLHNNGIIPDGFGNTERRYSANGILQGSQDAWEMIQSVCSNFAAKAYWNGSQISFWQDRPWIGLPRAIFTNAKVVDGRFIYTSQEWKGITTVAKVSWNDPAQDYGLVPEPIEYQQGILDWGVHEDEFSAFLCTSRGQAYRLGLKNILTSLLETEMVSFRALPESFYCRPGDVIQVQDNRRTQTRKGGLITSATTTSITVDLKNPVTLVGTSPYKVRVTLPNLQVEERFISNGAGTHLTLLPTQPFSMPPLSHAIWLVQDGAALEMLYRIISITPGEAENKMIYEISAKTYAG
jgi:predicted phage tail protein